MEPFEQYSAKSPYQYARAYGFEKMVYDFVGLRAGEDYWLVIGTGKSVGMICDGRPAMLSSDNRVGFAICFGGDEMRCENPDDWHFYDQMLYRMRLYKEREKAARRMARNALIVVVVGLVSLVSILVYVLTNLFE